MNQWVKEGVAREAHLKVMAHTHLVSLEGGGGASQTEKIDGAERVGEGTVDRRNGTKGRAKDNTGIRELWVDPELWGVGGEVGGRLWAQMALCVRLSLGFSVDTGKLFKSLKFMSDMIIFAF